MNSLAESMNSLVKVDQVYSTIQIANLLNEKPPTVAELCNSGKIKAKKNRGAWVIAHENLREYLVLNWNPILSHYNGFMKLKQNTKSGDEEKDLTDDQLVVKMINDRSSLIRYLKNEKDEQSKIVFIKDIDFYIAEKIK